MSLRIILVRHGQTEWNREYRIQGGSSDTALSAEGRRQAEELALAFSGSKVQGIYSSPLQRALDTARAIAAGSKLDITV